MKKVPITIIGLALFAVASVAAAQSTVTGTLSSGTSTTTLSGTVQTDNTLSGTVVSPSTGTSGGSSGGGGGTGSGSNVVDICPNIDGVQPTLSGYVMQNGLCIVATATGGGTTGTGGGGTVLGTSTEVPNVPNAGVGTDAATLLALALSALVAAGGAGYYLRQRIA